MKLSDLRKRNDFGAFNEFYPVSELKEMGVIPASQHKFFVDICECAEEFGVEESEVIMTKSGSRATCANPRCPFKTYNALAEMISRFGEKGIGEATCRTIVRRAYKHMQKPSHLEVFNMTDRQLTHNSDTVSFINFQSSLLSIREKKLTFGEMISKLAIPGFRDSAKDIFGEVKNSKDLMEQIQEAGGFLIYFQKRGINDLFIPFYLREFLWDIAYAESQVFGGVRPPGNVVINISITGNMMPINGTKMTKDKFIELCNLIGERNGRRLFEVRRNNAYHSNGFIIADTAEPNSNYLTAKNRENLLQEDVDRQRRLGYDVPDAKLIYSGQEFLDYLKGLVQ